MTTDISLALPPDDCSDKPTLRSWSIARRQALTATERTHAEQAICTHLLTRMATLPKDRVVGAYWPIRGEVDIRPFLEKLAQRWVVGLPVAITGQALRFLRWEPGAPMQQDHFGAAIPATHHLVQPDCLIVPCVGIDLQGYRLGYGGGFYDRTLARDVFKHRVIGIAFDCNVLPRLPHEPHDQPLDYWITESGLRQRKG